MSTVKERFLKYVSFDTQSEDFKESVPSTEKQLLLARELKKELEELGASDVYLSENGYVYAKIPASPGKEKLPTIGFISHMDTSNAVTGRDVRPVVTENYGGGDIRLSEGFTLSVAQNPGLLDCVGEQVITTDGTTLLGADDKAGIAEIMTLAERLLSDDAPAHCSVSIGFTPDEEVGRGVDFFDVKRFGANFAYTVDGGPVGDLNYESFNAAGARVEIKGTCIHPGSAYGRMVNASLVAMELEAMLPAHQKPASTEGYGGFFHLDSMKGNVDRAEMYYIIRDHSRELFNIKKRLFGDAVSYLNEKYGEGTVSVEINDQYYNMREVIEKDGMHLVENAKKAMEALGITPLVTPIRGGTDGARLSFMGLPCPNLCTGGYNCHGRYEFITVEAMEKCSDLLGRIVDIYSE